MKRCITLCGPSRELPQKNQSIHVEIQNKGFFWHVLGLFRLFLRCSWLVLGLFRLFLACSWVVQVVLGLFRGVPSFSNDGRKGISLVQDDNVYGSYNDKRLVLNNNNNNHCKHRCYREQG